MPDNDTPRELTATPRTDELTQAHYASACADAAGMGTEIPCEQAYFEVVVLAKNLERALSAAEAELRRTQGFLNTSERKLHDAEAALAQNPNRAAEKLTQEENDYLRGKLAAALSSRDGLVEALQQASFCLRTLLPNDSDAQLTVRMLDKALAAPSESNAEPPAYMSGAEVREAAARICEEHAAKRWDAYRRGDGSDRANPHAQGESDGAEQCALLIRALPLSEPSEGVRVPREPTSSMICAGINSSWKGLGPEDVRRIYVAMLSAAPGRSDG